MKKILSEIIGLINLNIENYIAVYKYERLQQSITDKYLKIEEIFPEAELDSIKANFEPYLRQECNFDVIPIIGILGGNVICIQIKENKVTKVLYYDMDFGCFELDNSIENFCAKLAKNIF